MAASAKKSKGRQKVVMVRMEKDSNRQVTFSKRRLGLFKKASELCTLCGAEGVIVVFSPGRKAFSFGHPSVESIINRFLISSPPPNEHDHLVEAHHNAQVCDLNMELTALGTRLDMERKRGEEISETRKEEGEKFWWDVPIEELKLPNLEHFKGCLEELRNDVIMHGNKLMVEVSRNNNPLATPYMHMGVDPMPPFDACYGYPPHQGYY